MFIMTVQRRTAPVLQPQLSAAGGIIAAAAPDVPAGVDKPSIFAVHTWQQRFRHPAMEAAFQRWQAENVFYKVRISAKIASLLAGVPVCDVPFLQQHGCRV